MDETITRARCSSCGGGLAFEDWSRGLKSCGRCRHAPADASPAAVYVRGPRSAAPPPARAGVQPRPPVRRPAAGSATAPAYERLLDDVPDTLLDEIVAALEAESQRLERENPGTPSPLAEVLDEIGFGRSPLEIQLAAWGFTLGFGANVALAKYAQMQTSSPMSEFVGPIIVGGLVAGVACAAIGWGLARLRER